MATKTYQQQLEDVQTAIAEIETRGQSVDVNGRQFTRANIARLYEREKYLRRMAARESSGGIVVRKAVPLD